MEPFPHHYRVATEIRPEEGRAALHAPGLPVLETAPPKEFGGSGEHWSPETLLVAAVADCFALSLKAVAQASRFEWQALRVDVEGKLDRIERKMRFTELTIHAALRVPPESESNATRILEKAEETCLITNSLAATVTLRPAVEVAR